MATEELPVRHGWFVYRLLNHDNDIIYIGMSKNLYARLGTHEKTYGNDIARILVFPCESAENAALCERTWIKKYQPYFNKIHNGNNYQPKQRHTKWQRKYGITPYELSKATSYTPQRALAYLSGEPVPVEMREAFDAVYALKMQPDPPPKPKPMPPRAPNIIPKSKGELDRLERAQRANIQQTIRANLHRNIPRPSKSWYSSS